MNTPFRPHELGDTDIPDALTATDTQHAPAPRRAGRTITIAIVCAGLLLGGGGAAAFFVSGGATASAEESTRPGVPTTTTKIEQGTLAGVSKVAGTLDYADTKTIGGGAGTVTGTPAPGTQIGLGQTLYSVDNIPIPLLHGPLPAWRAFGEGMSDGPDVLQLEMSLAALGYFDREPDHEFAASTAKAIARWQKALGVEQTGRLELGTVIFAPGDVRVAAVDTAVGSPAVPDVLKVSSLTKRIDVDLKLSDQQLGVVGARVDVSLPGGTTTTGTVTDVGVPTEKKDKDGGEGTVSVPVGIALDDPATAATLQRASVTVGFPSERRENVLFVPVEALVALDGKQFGVEVVDKTGKHRKLPVTTGLFADGKVEVSGDGIAAGLDVVVPAS